MDAEAGVMWVEEERRKKVGVLLVAALDPDTGALRLLPSAVLASEKEGATARLQMRSIRC